MEKCIENAREEALKILPKQQKEYMLTLLRKSVQAAAAISSQSSFETFNCKILNVMFQTQVLKCKFQALLLAQMSALVQLESFKHKFSTASFKCKLCFKCFFAITVLFH